MNYTISSKNRLSPNRWTDADVETHWDSVADRYIAENNKVKDAHVQRFEQSIPMLDLYCGARLLNITSRDGEAAFHVNRIEPEVRVINAEISAKLMDLASKLFPGISQVKISTYSELPFEDEAFDRILSLETLEHVEDPLKFLKELHRISIPDARMVLSCPPATSELPYRIYTALIGGHGEGPHKFPSSHEVKSWLRETGWELIMHRGTLLIPVGPEWLKRMGEAMIEKMQGTFIAELGIRQFYVCKKS
jgi:SAM-dependent methyltransferase